MLLTPGSFGASIYVCALAWKGLSSQAIWILDSGEEGALPEACPLDQRARTWLPMVVA